MPADPFVNLFEDWFELSRSLTMRRFIDQVRKSGLSMSQIGALFHLHKEGQCGVSELGSHLDVSNAAASQMLDRLVQHGLILRSEDPHDRRSKTIVLTEEGERIMREGLQARLGWLSHLSETLSGEEKATITEALHILIHNTKGLEEQFEVEIAK